ncbi:MAG TPA: hypothetical protein VMK32_08770 [Burkholderiaceae bacterium]|nr:hypothetical protein [Burkholderiaceae bacterium]
MISALRWRARRCAAGAVAGLLLLTGCSERLEWREARLPEATVMLPGRAQAVSRSVDFEGQSLPMTMHSTGVGASMFAIGIAALPPGLAADAATRRRAIAYFRDGLVRNIGGTVTSSAPATLTLAPGSLQRVTAGEALEARGRTADGRVAVLAARFFIVDDRLFELVALGGEGSIDAQALDTFFSSFRPLS